MKGQTVNSLSLADHLVSVAITQLYHGNTKAATFGMQMNVSGCVPIKLYIHVQCGNECWGPSANKTLFTNTENLIKLPQATKYYSFDFFQPFQNEKNILSSPASHTKTNKRPDFVSGL